MVTKTLNKEYEKIHALNENLYNISLKKDSKYEQKEVIEKVSFQEKNSVPNIISFNPAP